MSSPQFGPIVTKRLLLKSTHLVGASSSSTMLNSTWKPEVSLTNSTVKLKSLLVSWRKSWLVSIMNSTEEQTSTTEKLLDLNKKSKTRKENSSMPMISMTTSSSHKVKDLLPNSSNYKITLPTTDKHSKKLPSQEPMITKHSRVKLLSIMMLSQPSMNASNCWAQLKPHPLLKSRRSKRTWTKSQAHWKSTTNSKSSLRSS